MELQLGAVVFSDFFGLHSLQPQQLPPENWKMKFPLGIVPFQVRFGYIFDMAPSLDASDLFRIISYMFKIGDSELNLHFPLASREGAISNDVPGS